MTYLISNLIGFTYY